MGSGGGVGVPGGGRAAKVGGEAFITDMTADGWGPEHNARGRFATGKGPNFRDKDSDSATTRK